MKTKIILVLALALASSNLTLSAKAKYVTRWKNPEAQSTTWKGKKVLAFVKTLQTRARLAAEQAMVRELQRLGIEGVVATVLVPPEAEKNREMAKRILTEAQIAGALVMRVMEVKEEVQVGSGQTPYLTPSYATFYTGWESGWSAVPFGPGAVNLSATMVVETLVYSVDQDKLVWRGISETTDPQEIDKIVRQLIGATGKELKKAGLAGR